MKTKTTRRIDEQGRISLPGYIRSAMNLGPGNTVSVEIDNDGIVHIQAMEKRCCICGECREDGAMLDVIDHLICEHCARAIVAEANKGALK